MQGLFNIINVPLGYVMSFLANIFNNDFAIAVAVFTLLINLALIPLSIKSQKSSVQQMRIKPKMDELRKKYGDDRQKMAMAQQELFQQEGVSMSGGCLPMIIRLLIMMSIYWLILSPLTYIAQVDKNDVTVVSEAITDSMSFYADHDEVKYNEYKAKLTAAGWSEKETNSTNKDLMMTNIIRSENRDVVIELIKGTVDQKDGISAEEYNNIEAKYNSIIEKDEEANINYNLFGNEKLNLTQKPNFSWNIFKDAQLLWLIPVGAFLAQILTSLISMRVNKINNPDAPSMMGMMLTMPLISLFIGFGLPGGVGFYWICSSLIGGLMQSAIQLWYGPKKMLARERAKELGVQCDFETKQLEKFNNKVED